jgi:hypothetical protein
MITRTLRLLLLALAVSLVAAPASHADRTAQLMFEDPSIAPGTSAEAPSVIPRWASMGVNYVRIQAFWNAVSPQPNSRTIPAGFNPANPNDPQYNFADLDTAINRVRAAGMRVMLTVHQFNPVWASTQPSRGQQGWRPSPVRYGQFTTAVVSRYRGRIAAVAAGNEGNEKVFLEPQTSCTRYRVGRRFRTICERTSAHIYRNLLRALYPAVKRITRIPVVGFELAPIGGASLRAGNVAPLPFLREAACVDNRYRPIRIGACRGFRPARADLFGYHFYQVRARPMQRTPNVNSAKLGDIPRLFGVLDRLTRTGRIIAPGRGRNRRFNLWADEYGYETRPPDSRNGVTPAQQSRFLQESAYVVWAARRVKMFSQYLWRDDGSQGGVLIGFQTGLNWNPQVLGGIPKPSLATFPHPFFIDTRRGRRRALIWGQVRPGRSHTVTVFRNGARLLTVRTDGLGYFAVRRSLARGSRLFFRYTFGGQTFTSDTIGV